MEHFLFIRLIFWAALLAALLLAILLTALAKAFTGWIKSLKRKRDEIPVKKVVIARLEGDSIDQLAA